MKDFKALWKNAALVAGMLAAILALVGWLTGSPASWGLCAGIIPGEIDLVGLGLRLPLWSRLNARSAMMSLNLRLMSRLIFLGAYFYVLRRYTAVQLEWALGGIFIPHMVYLVWALVHSRGKGVNG